MRGFRIISAIFKADEREMTKYIIGTISGKDVPQNAADTGRPWQNAYFRGLTVEMLQKKSVTRS